MTCTEVIFSGLNLVVISITAVFIVLYWKETQGMKRQMVDQTRIANRQLHGSRMPILDIRFEVVKPSPEMPLGQIQFAYDVFICNKGSGPAFNISIQRYPSDTRGQKEAVRGPARGSIKPFQKSINIIGVDEEAKVHREHSDSYRSFKLIVRFSDVFKDNFEWIFEGDRDGVSLKNYDLFKNN